jgi:hypothetical protein
MVVMGWMVCAQRSRGLGESEVSDLPGSTYHSLFVFMAPAKESWSGACQVSSYPRAIKS